VGGCTNCGSKTGCDHRKGEMMGAVDAALAALYPSKTWGEPDERVAMSLRADATDLDGLAEELAQELRAATFVRHGGDDEPCDYIYVLCLGRTPCIVQVRDCEVPVPREWEPGVGCSELYLRVCISHRTQMAAIQQVAMEATYQDGVVTVREAPRAGVYDAPLLSRMQRAVAILPAYGLLHVDFGEIAGPPPGYAGGEWPVLYGEGRKLPSIANYLFFPQPPTMVSLACVPAAREA
jgi:hypothetical protein